MDLITVAVGILVCGYAVWVLSMRLQGKDDKFKKLQPMRNFWGPQLGSAIHYFGYVVVPLSIGVGIIISGLKGNSLLALLKR